MSNESPEKIASEEATLSLDKLLGIVERETHLHDTVKAAKAELSALRSACHTKDKEIDQLQALVTKLENEILYGTQ